MIAAYLPDKIQVKSAGEVKNIYNAITVDVSELTYEERRLSMRNIEKKPVPLFCIMLKINETEDGFTFTLSPS